MRVKCFALIVPLDCDHGVRPLDASPVRRLTLTALPRLRQGCTQRVACMPRWCTWRGRHDAARLRPQSIWVPTPDALLHAELHGAAAGAPIVLIHGLGGSLASWGAIPTALARERRVAVVDLRGCGRSERGSAAITIATLADDVAAVIAHLAAGRCHIVGHSLGGVVAQDLLVRHRRELRRCSAQ